MNIFAPSRKVLTVLCFLCSVHMTGYSVIVKPACLHLIMSSVSKKKLFACTVFAISMASGERSLQPHWWSLTPVLKRSLTRLL